MFDTTDTLHYFRGLHFSIKNLHPIKGLSGYQAVPYEYLNRFSPNVFCDIRKVHCPICDNNFVLQTLINNNVHYDVLISKSVKCKKCDEPLYFLRSSSSLSVRFWPKSIRTGPRMQPETKIDILKYYFRGLTFYQIMIKFDIGLVKSLNVIKDLTLPFLEEINDAIQNKKNNNMNLLLYKKHILLNIRDGYDYYSLTRNHTDKYIRLCNYIIKKMIKNSDQSFLEARINKIIKNNAF